MLILLAAALALTPASRLQREAEDQARTEVTDLFRALCPEQCVLLSLQAREGEDEARTGVTDPFRARCPERCALPPLQARGEEGGVERGAPGFDAPGDLKPPFPKGPAATVLLDGKLPPAFRGKVRDLVAQR